ncbi:MAG TPA: ATP-binding cassette domain-containing protein, partial [Acidimicrobiales bacterium]|nr:ATP-binding cassette domain-containing protein [Acidimicrobiales bacterium]
FATSDLFGAIRRYGVEFHRRDDAARAEVVLRSGALPEIDRADLFELREVVTAASTRPVNLRVERGARVVVTGPSGAGKTTLLETMLGWRAVVSGEVLRPASRVGVIQPTMTLLSGTLRENLLLGASVSDRTLRERLDELGLRGERFDDLSSELLADGRGLSDGERVRVLLARAFVAEVATLFIDDVAGLFDEATRGLVRAALTVRPELAIVEASVDRPLIVSPSARVELTP